MSEIGTHNFVLNIKDSYNHNVVILLILMILSLEKPRYPKNKVDTLYQTIIDSIIKKLMT